MRRQRSKDTEQKVADMCKIFCQLTCKTYQETGGRCFADGKCKARAKWRVRESNINKIKI